MLHKDARSGETDWREDGHHDRCPCAEYFRLLDYLRNFTAAELLWLWHNDAGQSNQDGATNNEADTNPVISLKLCIVEVAVGQ